MDNWEIEEKNRKIIQDFYYNKLNFCACGSPSDILYVIKNVLNVIDVKWKEMKRDTKNEYLEKICETYRDDLKRTLNQKDENYEDDFSINDGVEQIIYNILNEIDVLEHGSSISVSWLTGYGKEVLNALNSINGDDLDNVL